MEDINWDTLIDKIRRKACTPFIGAGAAYPTLPLGSELSEQLLRAEETRSGKRCPLVDRKDLASAAQYLAVMHRDALFPKDQIASILGAICGSGGPNFDGSDEPHAVLAECALPVYLTTNYDDFMVRALQSRGVYPRQEIARWTKQLQEETPRRGNHPEPDSNSPLVFHLHGRWQDAHSLVATEDDYLDFLVTLSRDINRYTVDRRVTIPLTIRRALTKNSLLFVGYSLGDINLRVILRALVSELPPSHQALHIAVQMHKDVEGLDAYIEKQFRDFLRISVFWGTAREFCAELRRRLRDK